MKYRDLFQLKAALSQDFGAKVWALVKPVGKMLAAIRRETDPYEAKLEPTPAMLAFRRELGALKAESAAQRPEVVNETIRNLVAQHVQAQIDENELRQLDVDMANDEVDIKLDPLPEALLHDGGVLRVDFKVYDLLARLGLIKE